VIVRVLDDQRGDTAATVRVDHLQGDVARRQALELERLAAGRCEQRLGLRDPRDDQLGFPFAAVATEELDDLILDGERRERHRGNSDGRHRHRPVQLGHEPHLFDERPFLQRIHQVRALRDRKTADRHTAWCPRDRSGRKVDEVGSSSRIGDADEKQPPALFDQRGLGAAGHDATRTGGVDVDARERVPIEDGLRFRHRARIIVLREHRDALDVCTRQRCAELRHRFERAIDARKVGLWRDRYAFSSN
jgi:hypothetical protein